MLLAPIAMHIPDGFLSVMVSVIFWAGSAAVIALALWRVGEDVGERQVPLMAVVAAAIFAGQMLNFPVAGGTSGHLMGAALAAILLGPWAAILVMTVVVSVQALLFQDGGLVVLGANNFNMGIVGVAVAYFVFTSVSRAAGKRPWGILAGGAIAGWASVVVASLGVALQLALSGSSPADLAIPAMFGVHLLIGIGEALITLGALAFIYSTRRDLLQSDGASAIRAGESRLVWIFGLLIALGLSVLSPIASANPDGLEYVAEQNGFLDRAQDPQYNIFPDYTVPGISNETLTVIAAGIIGTLIVFGVTLLVAYARRKRQAADGA
jgi:cobalt/nickel transport system permease protein